MTTEDPSAPDSFETSWASASKRFREKDVRIRGRGIENSVLRIVSGIHGLSAFTCLVSVFDVMFGIGQLHWPAWYMILVGIASILLIASASANWFMRTAPLALPVMAAASIIISLLIAGYIKSLVLWLNLLSVVLVAYVSYLRRRGNRGGEA